MVGLVAVIPGHFVFLRTLWKDNSIKMSTMIVLLLVAPNTLLPQFATSNASTLIGCTGLLMFCLLTSGGYLAM